MDRVTTRAALARRALSMLALAGLLLALCSGPALAETFTVKNSKSGGPGSLRSAIQGSNATPGEDTIRFDIPGKVESIVPASPLPAITEAVTIDGYTQPGASPSTSAEGNEVLKIRINGANAGRRANGLRIQADNTTIRGLVINRFKRNGILLEGNSATGNTIEGNYVGTDVTGTKDHANGRAGVRVVGGADNTIGGAEIGDPNLISHNRGGGVQVVGAERTVGNSVLSNRIYNNRGLGIDLGADGATENDPDDPDTGPNNLQNFPVIGSATTSGNTTTIAGTLNSVPDQSFTVQCFLAAPDPSGRGEARTLLDQDLDATTDAGGDAGFTCASDAPAVGDRVSATATNATTGDTSEFSENVTVR